MYIKKAEFTKLVTLLPFYGIILQTNKKILMWATEIEVLKITTTVPPGLDRF